MKLYDYFRSSAAYRVRIALNFKGVPYESVPIHLVKGEQSAPAYLAVNPQGRVPALDHDGAVIVQSPAILEYLDERFPEPPFLPRDLVRRARVRAAAALIGCDIHPLNNLAVLRRLKAMGHEQPAIDDWYRHWVVTGLEAVEAMIEGGPFCFGEAPTLADLYLVPQLYNARRFAVPLDPYPRIQAADAACLALPAFRDAAPEAQPDAA
ncbi:maleylacetoacetate isomerase [Salinarimonas soli]|uniref:Maleylacetoacetate isomerase n=1 Tax=Salinarimonas soli TaxID=1638099 RepID=A0A5B2V9G2_9HYPH|nr:maleylacetoacetate isomerase [Salinarimonas soli]KAA2236143.1 maleylacetoacetate isomerase [Salinarimonas soli]